MWSYIRTKVVLGGPAAARLVADEQSPLVDGYIAAYVAWREQTAEVQSAYKRWASGHVDSRAAFVLYRAELKLEEHAAQAYQEFTERLALAVGPRPPG
jgi:hypothetical protein